MDPDRASVAYGRRAVPQLFEQLQQPETSGRLRALTSLCDLVHEPERFYQTITGGKPEPPQTRSVIHVLFLISSSLLPPLWELLDDPSSSCRRNVYLVLTHLAELPAGADVLHTLVPRLMLKLQEEEEEEEEEKVLLLSILSSCSRVDPLPTLSLNGVHLMGQRLSHHSLDIRREACAVLLELSVPEDGKRQVCDQQLLPVLVSLLQDEDVELQTNAAGVIMNVVILTSGVWYLQWLSPHLMLLLSSWKKDVTLTLASLAEAPSGRRVLLEQLPLLERRSRDQDQDIQRVAQTTIRVVTWTP
uniref:Dynein axonemal assembly factor 5 TPR repeats domain-containing protein n=1 Tax=Nothobranchius furzeri TaxID=105023 RepID=A0A8C6NMD2_NOTFU